jgi:LAO/AO transport system kinase
MWSEVTESLLDAVRADPSAAALAARLEDDVVAGRITPTGAARAVLDAVLHGR